MGGGGTGKGKLKGKGMKVKYSDGIGEERGKEERAKKKNRCRRGEQ